MAGRGTSGLNNVNDTFRGSGGVSSDGEEL